MTPIIIVLFFAFRKIKTFYNITKLEIKVNLIFFSIVLIIKFKSQ